MPASRCPRGGRLRIEVDPELHRRIEIVAARNNISVRDYVETLLRRAIEVEEAGLPHGEHKAWSRLSARSFARDWASEGDQTYDTLSKGGVVS